jgi:NADPH:quinone reductase-like Zn-dependent oxidoreductase
MKAITLKKIGGAENLSLTELPLPEIATDQILIKVKAIGINPVDAFVRQNQQALESYVQPKNGSIVLGWDISGTVVAVGNSVSGFKEGDDVFGMVNFPGEGRAYAEYVAAPVLHMALKPANISHEEAAAATLAALTAWQALVTHARVKKGDKVLIHGAAGGVGHYAVQIAKHFGAYVIGTASGGKENFVKSLGADEFIDHTKVAFEDRVTDADIVIDPIYGDHVLRSLDAVKAGGKVITLLTFFEGTIAEKAKSKNVFAHRLKVSSNGEDMKQLAALLSSGEIHSHVTATYTFNDLAKAHLQIETGKTSGKIVVTV